MCHRRVLPAKPLFTNDIGVELDTAVDALLEYALDLVVEPWEAVERFLESQEIVEHWFCPVVPAFAWDDHADAGRIDQCQGCRNATADLIEGNIVDIVGDKALVGIP